MKKNILRVLLNNGEITNNGNITIHECDVYEIVLSLININLPKDLENLCNELINNDYLLNSIYDLEELNYEYDNYNNLTSKKNEILEYRKKLTIKLNNYLTSLLINELDKLTNYTTYLLEDVYYIYNKEEKEKFLNELYKSIS